MAIAGQSFLQDLGSTIEIIANNNYSNIAMCCGGDDDDDDASFEVVCEIPNAFSDDINLAEALSVIKKENTFAGTHNGTLDDEGEYTTDSGSAGEKAELSDLKQELRARIQNRRLSQGVGELKVTFDPPKVYPLSPDERQKVERRKKRNRDSANRSRMKRKMHEDELLQAVKELQEKNDALEREIIATKKVKHTLQKTLDNHLATYHLAGSTSASSSASMVDS